MRPCTLFCPRSGCGPVPARPICPVVIASAIRQRVVGAVHMLADAHAPENHRRFRRRIGARHSADRRCIDAANFRHPLRRCLGHRRFQRIKTVNPRSDEVRIGQAFERMTCSMPLSSATSVSGRNCRCHSAKRASGVWRGSASSSWAPRLTAFLIQLAATG